MVQLFIILVCFTVYDMNGDGYISKEEMFHLLKKCLQNSKIASDEDPDEAIRELVDLVMKKMVTVQI